MKDKKSPNNIEVKGVSLLGLHDILPEKYAELGKKENLSSKECLKRLAEDFKDEVAEYYPDLKFEPLKRKEFKHEIKYLTKSRKSSLFALLLKNGDLLIKEGVENLFEEGDKSLNQ